MKIEVKPKPFQPVTIWLTFETEEELAEFHSIFNHCAICDSVSLDGYHIRDCIDKLVPHSTREKFWSKLHQGLKNWARNGGII